MNFVKTDKILAGHSSVDSDEIGFFRIDRPYSEVVFQDRKSKKYFNAYGMILRRVK